MSDTITEHYRPYLEGGVVLFLIPSNLHTVTHTLLRQKRHFLAEVATLGGFSDPKWTKRNQGGRRERERERGERKTEDGSCMKNNNRVTEVQNYVSPRSRDIFFLYL